MSGLNEVAFFRSETEPAPVLTTRSIEFTQVGLIKWDPIRAKAPRPHGDLDIGKSAERYSAEQTFIGSWSGVIREDVLGGTMCGRTRVLLRCHCGYIWALPGGTNSAYGCIYCMHHRASGSESCQGDCMQDI
jgi:hypothetical protein